MARRRWEDPIGGREAFVDEACLRDAIRLVFEEDLDVTGNPLVFPAESLGGNTVQFSTARGTVTLLDATGLLLHGMFTDVGPSETTPSVPLEVAAANAQRVIDRIFPWARCMRRTGKPNDHGSMGMHYDISWRDIVDGVELPSWACSSTSSRGEVITFNGHYYSVTSPPRIVVDQKTALSIALAVSPPLTRLKSAKVQMGMKDGRMRTYWYLYLWTDSPPGFTGYRPLPGSIVLVDAITGDVLAP